MDIIRKLFLDIALGMYLHITDIQENFVILPSPAFSAILHKSAKIMRELPSGVGRRKRTYYYNIIPYTR